eukprot:COSAG02_NODE_12109_length_1594_cov_4.008027_1_plen_31_part_10
METVNAILASLNPTQRVSLYATMAGSTTLLY